MKKLILILFLNIITLVIYAQPSNDNCNNSISLSVNASCVYSGYTNVGATASSTVGTPAPGCANYLGGDIWFSFVVPASGSIIIDSQAGTMTDGAMAVYSGSCGSMTLISCDDDSSPNGLMPILTISGQTPGATLYIRFWEYGNNNNGSFSICITTSTSSGNQDCSNSTLVCFDASFSGNSSGFGTQNLSSSNQGCLSTEHQSSWYMFQAATSGTVSLTIQTSVDYDFAIWGPNVGCSSLGLPIRCSFAAGGANTGLGNGATDNSESAAGDKWVSPLPVVAGQTYIMLIDNFTSNSTSFTLDWTMSGGASLNCMSLPIELLYFNSEQKTCNQNILTWATATETNNDHFDIERSSDAINFKTIKEISGAINSLETKKYAYVDYNPEPGINYYRLKQVDLNGEFKYAPIIYVDNSCIRDLKIIKITNFLGQEVTEDYRAPKFIYYNDGSVIKKVGQ